MGERFDQDWIIIGSGFGGSVAALRLAEKGYHVAVLEQGRRYEDQDFAKNAWQSNKMSWMPKLGMRGIMAMTTFKHVTVISGVGVGGGSLVYGNTLYVPHSDEFYRHPNWDELADWRQVLKPHYQTAKRMLGITPYKGDGESERVMRAIATDLGVADTVHGTDVGVFFGEPGKTVPDPYFGGAGPARAGCVSCGQCMLGCRYNAKNTLVKNYLYLAQRLGVTIEAERKVIDIRPLGNGEGSDGYAIITERSGAWVRRQRRTETARGIVIAAGPLGTNQLLRCCKDRGSLPNISERLGHEIRTNNEAITAVTAPPGIDLRTPIAITSSVHPDEHTHFTNNTYGSGGDAMSLAFGPLTVGARRVPQFVRGMLRNPRRWLSIDRVRGWSQRSIVFTVMQSLDSSLRLEPKGPFGRLNTVLADGTPPVSFLPIANQVAELAAKHTGGYAQNSVFESLRNAPTTAHILGGAIIAPDPSRGVVDRHRRVFGYENLLITDGSTVPANVGVNPGLTITAMAEEAMTHIEPKTDTATRKVPDPPVAARSSLRELRRAFRAAPTPTLDDLVGLHEAEFAGPLWMRSAGAPTMALTGMPKWHGKRFQPAADAATFLDGVNVLRDAYGLVNSIPMRAEIAPSRLDGQPALIISYPPNARWPWRNVNDELRPVGKGTLLGLTFGLPLAPPGGVPFLLHLRE